MSRNILVWVKAVTLSTIDGVLFRLACVRQNLELQSSSEGCPFLVR